MAYVSDYKPPVNPIIQPRSDDDPIDLNFCLPIPEKLESERVKLVPLIPKIHGGQLHEAVNDHPRLYDYLPYGPFRTDTPSAFAMWFEERQRGDPLSILFAIIDKTKPSPATHPDQGGPLAGVLGYLLTSPQDLTTEIGHVTIFPPWQRTFLTTNAVGLLLIHALEVPDPAKPNGGGWGLRRVQWQAYPENAPSVRTAERMGMKMEGIIRWVKTIPAEHASPYGSVEARTGDPAPQRPGRFSALLAMCWDHYSRVEIEEKMARKN